VTETTATLRLRFWTVDPNAYNIAGYLKTLYSGLQHGMIGAFYSLLVSTWESGERSRKHWVELLFGFGKTF
jgi:hypothetical protein